MLFVFTTDSLRRGGKERQMSLLARQLLKSGNQVFLLAKDFDDTNNYLEEYELEKGLIFRYSRFGQFRRIIKRLNPDVVISWDTISSLYSLILYKWMNYKFVNGSIRHGIRAFKFSHFLRSFTAWLSPHVIANSVKGLSANNMRPSSSRFILYNGIENKFLDNEIYESYRSIELRRLFPDNYSLKDIVFISVANLVPYKDYITVLKAFKCIGSEISFKYLIIGEGPMRGQIENEIIELGLINKVKLLGRVENVKKYLELSDIMVHSSKGEGISNAILEGMYHGLPIIASKVGGVPETVFQEYTLLFRYKNQNELINCLRKAPELQERFDRNNPEYIEHLRKFSQTNMISKFEEIMEKVLN